MRSARNVVDTLRYIGDTRSGYDLIYATHKHSFRQRDLNFEYLSKFVLDQNIFHLVFNNLQFYLARLKFTLISGKI